MRVYSGEASHQWLSNLVDVRFVCPGKDGLRNRNQGLGQDRRILGPIVVALEVHSSREFDRSGERGAIVQLLAGAWVRVGGPKSLTGCRYPDDRGAIC